MNRQGTKSRMRRRGGGRLDVSRTLEWHGVKTAMSLTRTYCRLGTKSGVKGRRGGRSVRLGVCSVRLVLRLHWMRCWSYQKEKTCKAVPSVVLHLALMVSAERMARRHPNSIGFGYGAANTR